jgi:hypothetical protein
LIGEIPDRAAYAAAALTLISGIVCLALLERAPFERQQKKHREV